MRMYITEQYHIKGKEMWWECYIALWCTFSLHLFTFDVILLCDVHSHHISLPLIWYCSVMYILITFLYLWCDIALWCTFSSHLFTFDVILFCDVHSHHISLPLMWYCSVMYILITSLYLWCDIALWCTFSSHLFTFSNITSRVKRCDENVHHRAISHQRYRDVMRMYITEQYHIKGKEMWWECTSQSNITSEVTRCDENVHHRAISHQRYRDVMRMYITEQLSCDIALWCTFSSHLFTFDVILLCDVHSHHISLPLMWYCSVMYIHKDVTRMYITEQYHIKGTEMWWECTSQSNITSKVQRCDENVHHRAISHQG
jgi:hypothetical protein